MTATTPLPLLKSKSLTIGTADSDVAICTLWAGQDRVAALLPKESYAIIGNLYSRDGLNYLLRNLLAWSHIRHLYMLGPDRSHTGNMLHQFFGGRDQPVLEIADVLSIWQRNGFRLDPAFSLSNLDRLRRQVTLYDLRTEGYSESLLTTLARLRDMQGSVQPSLYSGFQFSPLDVHLGTYNPPKVRLPGHATGVLFRSTTMRQAWPHLARYVWQHGEEVTTDQTSYLQSLGMTTILSRPEIALESALLEEWGIAEGQAEAYVARFWSGEKDTALHYEYGERVNAYPFYDKHGCDSTFNQYYAALNCLRNPRAVRRAYIDLWRSGDADPDQFDTYADNPPCLTSLLVSVGDGKVYLTASYRSHDLFAWPLNTILLSEILKKFSEDLALPIGALTIHSENLHIYSEKWATVERFLDGAGHFPLPRFNDDPLGYWLIEIEADVVVARHGTATTGLSGNVFVGKEADALTRSILSTNLVGNIEHAAYIGSEVRRAFYCLQNQKPFVQDKED